MSGKCRCDFEHTGYHALMIKKLRLSHGWSQEQLAQLSGLSTRTIQRIERGHNGGLESMKCIAATLNVKLSDITAGDEHANELFLGVSPILPVKNVKETAFFYKEYLGFDIEVLWENPPYGVVSRGLATIEFGEGRMEFSGSGVCNVFVDDVDRIYQEFISKDIEIVGEIKNRDYGSRDFRIADNNGNILILTSPLLNQQEMINKQNSIF